MANHTRMLLGFLIGVVGGLCAYAFTQGDAPWLNTLMTYVTEPIGTVFLRLLFMLVLPLVFSALITGIAELGDVRLLGRLGVRMGLFTVVFTGIAVVTGVVLMNWFRPGDGFDPELAMELMRRSGDRVGEIVQTGEGAKGGIGLFIQMVPTNVFHALASNDVLGVMFFALFFGVGLVLTGTPASGRLLEMIQGILDTSMTLIHLVILAAPVAVACLVFNLTAVMGWDVLVSLAGFVGVTLLAMGIQFIVVYGAGLWILAGRNPWEFLKGAREALLMAFSTSSSSASLPTTLDVAENSLKLPRKISRFVLTIGATANQHGTALFEGVTVLFLAQFFGVELALGEQFTIMTICILGGIGTAGVPAGSLPVIAMICGMYGIPPQGIGIILGVDRFLDMCRTTVNVGGDLVAVAVLSRNQDDMEDGVVEA